MIRILGRLYWNFARTFLSAPHDAEPPILLYVDISIDQVTVRMYEHNDVSVS